MAATPQAVVESWVGNKARRASVAIKHGKTQKDYKIINATDFDPEKHTLFEGDLPAHDINETAEDARLKVDEAGRIEIAAIRAKQDVEVAEAKAVAAEARAEAMRIDADRKVAEAAEANKSAQIALEEQRALIEGEARPSEVKTRGRPKS